MSYFSSSRDNSPRPLLQDHHESVSLQNLSPRVSPSPPPSFYRDLNAQNGHDAFGTSAGGSTTGSVTRSQGRSPSARKIQFAGPPPPIASSVLLSPLGRSGWQTSADGASGSGSGEGTSGKGRSRDGIHIHTSRPGSGISISSMDPLLVLERRERALQTELQSLLDAQSAGLIHGFGGSERKDADSDAGSSTPTTRSMHGASASKDKETKGVVPVRQPKKRVLGLRGARRGLLRNMGALVRVKEEEAAFLEVDISKREEVLRQVTEWEERTERVRGELESYSSGTNAADGQRGAGGGEEATEIRGLQDEERAVDNEIREMEDRLMQMRARKRWLGERIRESVNKQESRLSSYRGALKNVENEVREFLRRPPLATSVLMAGEEGFMAFPANRRTLGMAREWWEKELQALRKRAEEVERERAALDDGAGIWSASVDSIVRFEDELRERMGSGNVGSRDMLREQIERMDGVIKELEETMEGVVGKGWNLLICSVGAELEAFRVGKGILEGALGDNNGIEKDHEKIGEGGRAGESLLDSPDTDNHRNPHTHNNDNENENHNIRTPTDDHHDDHESTDTDTELLRELNQSVGVGGTTKDGLDGPTELKTHGLSAHTHHGRTSFGSEAESTESDEPDLAALMVDVDRRGS